MVYRRGRRGTSSGGIWIGTLLEFTLKVHSITKEGIRKHLTNGVTLRVINALSTSLDGVNLEVIPHQQLFHLKFYFHTIHRNFSENQSAARQSGINQASFYQSSGIKDRRSFELIRGAAFMVPSDNIGQSEEQTCTSFEQQVLLSSIAHLPSFSTFVSPASTQFPTTPAQAPQIQGS